MDNPRETFNSVDDDILEENEEIEEIENEDFGYFSQAKRPRLDEPVLGPIPSKIVENPAELVKFFCNYGEDSIADRIIRATNLKLKAKLASIPNPHRTDMYFSEITKEDFYAFVGLCLLNTGWRGKFENRKSFFAKLKFDPRLKDKVLMTKERFDKILMYLDVGENFEAQEQGLN